MGPSTPEILLEDIRRLLRGELPLSEEGKNYQAVLPFTKPETALTEKIWLPLVELLQKEARVAWSGQMQAGDGWVDYLIRGASGNPVAIELKPPLVWDKKQKKIVSRDLDWHLRDLSSMESSGRNQVKDYLRDYEYVVLTNLVEYALFNREALVRFEPFARGEFADLYREIRQVADPWEALRRIEDRTPRHGLDRRFYEDLKRWYARLTEVRFREGLSEQEKAEKRVLLLNKFVFAQTLEDHALIPFRFLRDKYEEARRLWGPKGTAKVAEAFLRGVDEWFYAFYDTELFQDSFLEHLEQDPKNLEGFLLAMEEILGFGAWQATFGQGLLHYNYRAIDEDVFGKAYETFLAQGRKEGGIYYTPSSLTALMAKMAVEETLWPRARELDRALGEERYDEAEARARDLTQVAFLDPAAGSGSFLVKILREVVEVYAYLEERTRWALELQEGLFLPPAQARAREAVLKVRDILGFSGLWPDPKVLSRLILRHLVAVDLDTRALDVARVNLWKEAIKLAPKAFRYTNLGQVGHALPDLRLNLIHGDTLLSPPRGEVLKALAPRSADLKRLWSLREAYLRNPLDHAPLEEALALKDQLRKDLNKELNLGDGTFLELEFFWLFFDPEGEPLPNPGAHVVIGNPPWENVKPFKKEYAARFPQFFGEDFSKFALDDKEFERRFQEALKDQGFREGWEAYQESRRMYAGFLKERYPLMGQGDPSLQKAFLARALELAREAVVFLVPSNFHTDLGARLLRETILEKRILALFSFENRGKRWFADVHPQFKFDLLAFRMDQQSQGTFPARFYIRKEEEWNRHFPYPLDTLERFSPWAKGLVEFRYHGDIPLASAIRGTHPLLGELGYEFGTDFHMTADKGLFREASSSLPSLLEGKSVHQYNPRFEPSRYGVDPSEGYEELLRRELARLKGHYQELAKRKGLGAKEAKAFVRDQLAKAEERFRRGAWRLPHQLPRLVWRDVASSTNERTLIAARVPAGVFLGNTLNYVRPYRYRVGEEEVDQEVVPEEEFLYLLALFNSFVLDYYLRLRTTSHVNIFFLRELPIPMPDPGLKARVVALAKKVEASLAQNREDRAELEALIAREVFHLTQCQFARVLATFRFGQVDRELLRLSLKGS